MGALRGLLFALIGGIASAILSIGSFGPAPILVIGFYLGSSFAGISTGIAALLILINFNSISTIFYIAGTGLPALIIVRQALISQPGAAPNTVTWYPPGQILAWLTAYGLLVLGCITLYFAFSSNALEAVSRNFLNEVFGQFIEQSDVKFRSDADKTLVQNFLTALATQMAPLLAGLLLSIYLLILIANATITQGILNRAKMSLRPSPSYVTMELPKWLGIGLAIAIVVAILPGALGVLGKNAALLLATPFLLLGLTVIHTLSRRTPNPRMVLVAIYFALFLLVALIGASMPVIGLLTLLGIAEQWTSLRQRFAAPGANKEDE